MLCHYVIYDLMITFSLNLGQAHFNPSMRNTWWLPSEHLCSLEHRLRNPADCRMKRRIYELNRNGVRSTM